MKCETQYTVITTAQTNKANMRVNRQPFVPIRALTMTPNCILGLEPAQVLLWDSKVQIRAVKLN